MNRESLENSYIYVLRTLSGKNNVTSDKVNFREEIKEKPVLWKKSGYQKFVFV